MAEFTFLDEESPGSASQPGPGAGAFTFLDEAPAPPMTAPPPTEAPQVSNVAAKGARQDVGPATEAEESAFGMDMPGGGIQATPEQAGGLPLTAGETGGVIREFAGGLSFNLADEGEALLRSFVGDETLQEELDEVRGEMRQFREANPELATVANVAGALTTAAVPAGMVARGGTMLAQGVRGAAAGSAFGAASEFGAGEGLEDRLERARGGAVTGALVGAAAPAAGRALAETAKLIRNRVTNAQTLETLRDTARAGFQAIEQSGLRLRPDVTARLFRSIPRETLRNIDPALTPRAAAAFRRLQQVAQTGSPSPGRIGTPTLSDLVAERQVIAKAARNTTDDFDRDTLRSLQRTVDDFIDNLAPRELGVGAATPQANNLIRTYREANNAWRRFRRGEELSRMIERATEQARQGGVEQAIKNEFRKLLRNDRRMRMFNAEERKAIRRAARRGIISGPLALAGRAAPRGFFSGQLPIMTAAVTGSPLPLVGMAVGEPARQLANVAARRRAQQAFETATTGRPVAAALPEPAARGVNMLALGGTGAPPVAGQPGPTNALARARRERQ